MNVSETTISAIHELNGECFEMNRQWDAAVTILGVRYVCHTASKLMHHYIAHWYPAIADVLNEQCLENFNIEAFYPSTSEGYTNYSNLQDMMNKMLERTIDFQNKVMATREIANNNKDYSVVVEIDKILLDVNKQVAQMLLINDKAEQYQNDYTSFDKDFPTFFVLADSEG